MRQFVPEFTCIGGEKVKIRVIARSREMEIPLTFYAYGK